MDVAYIAPVLTHDHAAHEPTDDQRGGDASPAFVDAVVRILTDAGPLSVAGLAEQVRAAVPEQVGALDDVDLRTSLRAIGRNDERLWTVGDGRVGSIAGVFDGVRYRHRLTDDELRREVLDGTPDLVGLPELDEFRLIGAATATPGPDAVVEVRFGDERAHADGSLVGPPGWLAGFRPGDVVVVSWSDGGVSVAVADGPTDPAADDHHAALVRAAFDARSTDTPPEPYELVRDVLVVHSDAFRGGDVAPISELLVAAGLERRGDWLVAEGTAADDGAVARARLIDQAMRTEGLRGCCSRALRVAFDEWNRWAADPDPDSDPDADTEGAATAAAALDHGPVVVLLHQSIVLGGGGDDGLARWAAHLDDRLAPKVSAGAAYLRARALDGEGDPVGAMDRLEAGLAAQRDHIGVQLLLADLLEDRGEIVRPLELLRGAGVPAAEGRVATLQSFVARARTTGRNDACPCGSGRKFKACCSRTGAVVRPVERARWLVLRAFRATAEGEGAVAVVNLRSRLERVLPPQLVGPVLADVQLFERGELQRYLDGRGRLLTAEDRALAERWLTEPMRLLEVGERGADGTLPLHDVVNGAPFSLHVETTAVPAPGTLVVARLLPSTVTGEGRRLVAGAPLVVAPEDRDRVAEALGSGDLTTDLLVELLASLRSADAAKVGS